MLSLKEKVNYLEEQLNTIGDNYADSLKTDISIFIDDFNEVNPLLQFLNHLSSEVEITAWINKLTSRIVMKEHEDGLNEIIFDYIG